MQRPSQAPQTPPPTARLLVNVYEKGTNKLLVTFSQNVSSEGENKWEELNIGLTAKADVQVEISCENASNITPVFFDNLSVKVQAVPTVLVVQENHYYPFGLGMKGLDWVLPSGKENKYQYNGGVEKNTDFDLGWYETDYRNLDTQINRFVQVDPKSEAGGQEVLTTYQYGFNNPIRYNDPKGDCPPGVNCGDWLLGAVAALVDNAMGGITPVRGIVANYISDKSGASFNRGQDVGDVASMVVGVAVAGGGVAGGAAFAPVTVGSSAVGGAMVARAGVATALAGASNLANQKGRVNADILKPGKGKGTEPPANRDPQRLYTKQQKQDKLDEQGGVCVSCGNKLPLDQAKGHHEVRHADGGKTNPDNLKVLCEDCHKKIHKQD